MTNASIIAWVLRSALFLIAAVPTIIYAARYGGSPERATAALIVAAVIATTCVPSVPNQTYWSVVTPLLTIDVAMLVGLIALALLADRYWPMYVAAVQLLTVAVHGVRAYDPSILPNVYARLNGELGYPVLALLAAGTWRHIRRSPERDWSYALGGLWHYGRDDQFRGSDGPTD